MRCSLYPLGSFWFFPPLLFFLLLGVFSYCRLSALVGVRCVTEETKDGGRASFVTFVVGIITIAFCFSPSSSSSTSRVGA